MGPLFFLLPIALAVQPQEGTPSSQEPVRIRRYHVERQHDLRHAESWQNFLAGEGAGWLARFDERTGTAHRAWGPPVDLGVAPDADASAVAEAVAAFLGRHGELTGLNADALRLGRVAQVPSSGAWVLRFDQVLPGASDGHEQWSQGPTPLAELWKHGAPPVWRGGVVARVLNGRLVMLGFDTYPDMGQVSANPSISAKTAVQVAIDDGPASTSVHDIEGTTLVVLPVERGSHVDLRLAWVVRTRTAEPVGQWVSFVDARTGDLLNVHNQVRFLAGTVYGLHDTRTVDGNTSTSVMPWIEVKSDSVADYADEDGVFAISGSGLTAKLKGKYVQVSNQGGSSGSMNWSNGDATWTTSYATQAEIDSYRFIHDVQAWGSIYGSDLDMVNDRLTSNVNISSSCNAYYDGAVNFYEDGSGCNNTGRIADVNYHEWGHGLHVSAAGTWWVDGSIGEGAGDTTAFLQTGDNRIAPYFYTSGGAIRDVSPDSVYPDDWVGEVHYDGLIFAGAVWDLWGELEGEMSADDAHDTLSAMFVDALRENPETETSYDAIVAADDDNGDLSDGTPNMCSIIQAFSPHGLGPAGGSALVALSHDPLGNQAASTSEYPLAVDVVNMAPTCTDLNVTSAKVFFSTDDGASWDSATLSLSEATATGAIPKQAPGTIVQYYIAAEDADAGTITVPSGGTINPFTFFVGDLVELYCENFESDDGGYTHELISGSNQEGADDWQWGTPGGMGGDPDFSASGDNVWGNDLGGGNYNGEYQDGKWNRLTSIAIDVSGYDQLYLQYERWLNVEDGVYDKARILSNGGTAWQNHATSEAQGDQHHEDEQWALHTVALSDVGDELTLAWEIESDRGLSFGGWNIDDVCIYALSDVQDTGDPGDTGNSGNSGDTGDAGDSGGSNFAPNGDPGDLTACGCASGGQAGGGALFGLFAAGFALVSRRRR